MTMLCRTHLTALLPFVFFAIISPNLADVSTLRYVNAVFRHGDRTPSTLYPNDGYGNEMFEPTGLTQLVNRGKQRSYDLGVTLRKRYGKLLGEFYKPGLVETRSTDTDRTKMSLQLILAGLFPPVGTAVWNSSFQWQPIPYNYVPAAVDGILSPLMACDKYANLLKDLLQSGQAEELFKPYEMLAKTASLKSGFNVTNLFDLFLMYDSLVIKQELDILPDWGKDFVDVLVEPAIAAQYLLQFNLTMIRRSGGVLLRHMVKNMVNVINGTEREKMYLYSAHDLVISSILFALDSYKPHMPKYTSGVLLELHEIKGVYYVKVLYYHGIPEVFEELPIKGCRNPCSFDKFLKVMARTMATDDDICENEYANDRMAVEPIWMQLHH